MGIEVNGHKVTFEGKTYDLGSLPSVDKARENAKDESERADRKAKHGTGSADEVERHRIRSRMYAALADKLEADRRADDERRKESANRKRAATREHNKDPFGFGREEKPKAKHKVRKGMFGY